MDKAERSDLLRSLKQGVERAVIGKGEVVDLVLCALLCGGHVLIEDVPGLGKTTLVSALAQCLGCSFQRIQFTPDVLPSDITGYTAFNLKTGEKEFQEGAVMRQIILADEINRTSPKTQSALLQAMQEGMVTVDGTTYSLPRPFLVLATQNPVGLTGTYPLPEAQLDRFLLRIAMGYPDKAQEVKILQRHREDPRPPELGPVASAEDVLELQRALDGIACSLPVMNYIVNIAGKTRESQDISLGASPRGSIALMRASMAWAMLEGRDYVIPDDVQRMVQPVLAHRLVMHPQASLQNLTPDAALKALLRQVPVPAVAP